MRELKRNRAWAASLSSAVLILTAGAAPAGALAADHLDAPTIAQHGDRDITDLYAFSTQAGNKSVFILNVNPGAGALPTSGTTFGPSVRYRIKIDTNADLTPDVTFTFRFGQVSGGHQDYTLWRNGKAIAQGQTGTSSQITGGGMVTAGLYDDPFFFDLDAFKGEVLVNGCMPSPRVTAKPSWRRTWSGHATMLARHWASASW